MVERFRSTTRDGIDVSQKCKCLYRMIAGSACRDDGAASATRGCCSALREVASRTTGPTTISPQTTLDGMGTCIT